MQEAHLKYVWYHRVSRRTFLILAAGSIIALTSFAFFSRSVRRAYVRRVIVARMRPLDPPEQVIESFLDDFEEKYHAYKRPSFYLASFANIVFGLGMVRAVVPTHYATRLIDFEDSTATSLILSTDYMSPGACGKSWNYVAYYDPYANPCFNVLTNNRQLKCD